ncbi:leucine-rich repeat-containing protein 17 [Microcaecilia unicolor]|uniref:Leucine-rich repeat-containing protein 17 n=1 Tax=Microcaecilia unicolor TaxID=1415580 RepID=A0A6P7YZ51_9AMPH|nr:leucine-rich repeat-containing protein 17 [Microcaecilia unicolor]
MRLVTLTVLLLFCKAAEFRKAKNGRSRNRAENGKAGRLRKGSGTVKRYAPGLPCDVYTYLHEKYIDCQERKLTSALPDWPEDLMHMLLARNRIHKLENNMFSKFRKLKSLDLQQNDISKIEDQAFFGLNKLTTLLLQHNRIKILSEEVFIYLPRLNYLRLYDNPWHCSCEIETLVTMLQVPRNRNLGNYAKCESPPHLKGQKLKVIRSELLCPLEEDIQPYQQMALSPPVVKPIVDSSICHIYMFPILTLDCKKKELQDIPTDIPQDTVKLDLSNNNIKVLRSKAFDEVPNLEILNLRNNGIEYIDPAAFSGLMNLKELNLSNNSLHNFEYGVLEDLYFLKNLWLRDNPWRCDYHIHYLFYWLRHHYTVNYYGLECKTPEEYKGWYVGKYVQSYYEECPKDKLPAHADQDTEEDEKERQKEHSSQIQTVKQHSVMLTVFS